MGDPEKGLKGLPKTFVGAGNSRGRLSPEKKKYVEQKYAISDTSEYESEDEEEVSEAVKEAMWRDLDVDVNMKAPRGKGKRTRVLSVPDEEEEDEVRPKKTAYPKKAPPGYYQGMAKAKSDLRGDLDGEFVAELDAAVEAGGRKSERLQEQQATGCNQEGPNTGEALDGIRSASAIVRDEIRKSKNLSGKVVGKINSALREIAQSLEVMEERKENEEIRILRADNKRMREQLAHLDAETKALRKAFSERRAEPQAEPRPLPESQLPALLKSALAEMREDLKRDIIVTAGEMINARLEGIRSRLPPEPTIRPLLEADRKAAAAAAAPQLESPRTPQTAPTPAPAAPKVQRKPKRKAPAAPTQPAAQPTPAPRRPQGPSMAPPPPPTLQREEETWTNVVGRKTQMKAKKAAAVASQPRIPVPTPRRLGPKVPTTAGVVVALKPGSEATYSSILARATTAFSLAEVGLEHVRVRKTADGARILEVANTDNGRAAELLRTRLEAVIGEDARIYRPVKMADLRVSGLLECATPEAVAAAIAYKGDCSTQDVKVGAIRVDPNGSGSTLVRCPVVAARRVCESGRLNVGWSGALVRALEQAPLRCFRCMGVGHTRATCPSEVERGELCFRCSKPGHKAASCAETPFCAVCHHGRLPAGHTMGGLACHPPQTRGRAVPVRTTETAEPISEGNNMDL
jgi:hypothetical protein